MEYISEFYHEDPQSYDKECSELEQLHQTATKVSRDFMGCSTLKKYFCQLQFLQSRFPMAEGGSLALSFTWDDVYSGQSVTQVDIRYEQACVLYNIGALHSILGAMDNRQSPEGMKVSCTHFQCAAWAFQHLRDFFGSNLTTDMSPDLLSFHINLMLAQAQECILEKSMTDNRKSSITAKVAAQIMQYYTLAMRNLDTGSTSQVVGARKLKEWKKRLELKSSYHLCVMYLYQSNQSEEQQKWGERLCYLQAGLDKLNECIKLAKSDEEDIQEALKFTMDVVGGKYNSAKKDNDFVYHEKVPSLDSLPDVKGASLVKGIAFNPNDPEVSGVDIFHKLVPMEAHQASSLYSEEKAKLLRRVGTEVDEKNQELIQYMASLQLSPENLYPDPEKLPQTLMEKCAAISVKPNAVKDLVASMNSLSSVSTDVEGNLNEIADLLETEDLREQDFQKVCGKRTINVIVEELAKDCEKYKRGLETASHSNMELHRAMNTHIANLRLLSGPLDELQAAIPSVEQSQSPEDAALIEEMKRLMSKVDEMRSQRNALEEQFRQQVHKDDITSVLVTRDDGNQETFFAEQLKKHDKVVGLIEQNLTAQNNILRVLTETNAKYANIRKYIAETNERRAAMVEQLILSYDVYEDLLAKSQKGVDFYRKLEANVMRLLERTQGFCKIQEEERQQILSRQQPKAPVVVPSRPTAPKPGGGGYSAAPVDPTLPAVPGLPLPTSIPQSAGPALPAAAADPAPDGPTLKDFLPMLKPATFGPKSRIASGGAAGARARANPALPTGGLSGIGQVPQVSGQSGSLPPSMTASPVHLPQHSNSQPGSPACRHKQVAEQPDTQVAPPGAPHPRVAYSQYQPEATPANQHGGLTQTTGTPLAGYQLPTSLSTSIGIQPASLQTPPVVSSGPTQYPQTTSTLPAMITSTESVAPHAGQQGVHNYGYMYSSGQNYPNGPQAQAGAQGQPGVEVQPGMPGQTGMLGQPGVRGQPDIPGLPGVQGQPGVPGQPGLQGQPGVPGQPGVQGQPGVPGHLGVQGQPGVPGHPGVQGQPGVPGHPGVQGQPGVPGHPGVQGQPGVPRHPGVQGQPTTQPGGQMLSMTQSGTQVQPATQPGKQAQSQAVTPGSSSTAAPGSHASQYSFQYEQSSAAVKSQTTYSQYSYQQLGQGQPAGQSQLPGQGQLPLQGQSQLPGQGQITDHIQVPSRGNISGQGHLPGQMQVGGQSQMPVQGQLASQVQPSGQGQSAAQGQSATPSQLAASSFTYAKPFTYPGQSPYSQGPVSQVPPASTYSAPGTVPSMTAVPPVAAQQPQYSSGLQTQYQQHGAQPQQPSTTQPQYPANVQSQYVANSQLKYSGSAEYSGGSQYPASVQHTPTTQAQQYSATLPSQPGATIQSQYHNPAQYAQSNYAAPTQPSASIPSQYGQVPQMNRQEARAQYFASQQLQQQQKQQPQTSTGTHYSQPYSTVGDVQPAVTIAQGSYAAGYAQYGTQGYPQQQAHGKTFGVSQAQMAPMPTTVPQQQDTARPAYQGVYPAQQQQQPQGSGQQQPQGSGQQQPQGSGQQQPQGSGQQQQPGPSQQFGTYQHDQQGLAAQSGACPGVPPQQSYGPRQPGQYSNQQPSYGPQQVEQRFATPMPRQPTSNQWGSTHGYAQAYGGSGPPPQLPSPLKPMSAGIQSGSPQMLAPATPPAQPASSLPLLEQAKPQQQPQQQSSLPLLEQTESHQQSQQQQQVPAQPPSPAPAVHRRLPSASSLDDILNASPDTTQIGPAQNNVLTPKVITAEDRRRQKEEEQKNSLKQPHGDPYANQVVLRKFAAEVEKFEKQLEVMCKQPLSGSTLLDKEWKELMEDQEKEARKHSIAIARCYPLKNRRPDVLPYDNTRVILTGSKDDYINASHIGDLSPCCPKFIATQSPLQATTADFWQMVYEQGSEVIVMLCKEQEAGSQKIIPYWPEERGKQVHYGPFVLGLQSVKSKGAWLERILTLTHKEKHHSRSIVHLQFLDWSPGGTPESPAPLLQFIQEVHVFYIQQRNLMKPVLLHCSLGVGRTGAFCVIYTGQQEIQQGNGLVEVAQLVRQLQDKRKYIMQDKEQLRFCYHAILYHAQDVLMKWGILTNKASFGDKRATDKNHQRKPSDDFIMGSNTSLSAIQANIAKMSIKKVQTTKSESSADGTSSPAGGVALEPVVSSNSTTPQSSAMSSTENSHEGSEIQDEGEPGSLPVSIPPISDQAKPELPSSLPNSSPHLAELQNPNTFKIGEVTPPNRRKITRANFTSKTSSISNLPADPTDPLSSLDPLWTMKPSGSSQMKS